jgi:hypothetical protein
MSAVASPLQDGWGRAIHSLRVSVTDRCNFRCRYCMPAYGLPWLPKPELLTFEEIHRLVRVMADMGVDEVRLTGGEPLVRRDLPERACSHSASGTSARRCAKGPTTRGSPTASARRSTTRKLKHRVNDPGFVRASRTMSQIGG